MTTLSGKQYLSAMAIENPRKPVKGSKSPSVETKESTKALLAKLDLNIAAKLLAKKI